MFEDFDDFDDFSTLGAHVQQADLVEVQGRVASYASTHGQEIRDLHSTVSQLQRRLNALDEERANILSRIESTTSQLSGKQLMETSNGNSKQLLSFQSGSRIPVDVLRHIFINCLPDEGEAIMNPHEAPLVFGQVCAFWRSVAWSTPELWDTLHVPIPALDHTPELDGPTKWQTYLLTITAWLERSRGRPLSLALMDEDTLDWTPYVHDPRSALITDALNCLVTQSFRWKSLRLGLLDSFVSSFHILSLNAPMLEAFHYQPPYLGSEILPKDVTPLILVLPSFWQSVGSDALSVPQWISRLPQLRCLHLFDVPILGDILAGDEWTDIFRWESMVDLRIGHANPRYNQALTPAAASRILSHLSNLNSPLQTCHFVLTDRSTNHLGNAGNQGLALEIALPSLEDFTVTVHKPHNVKTVDDQFLQELFQTISAPSLTSFTYMTPSKSSFPFLPLLTQSLDLRVLGLFLPCDWATIEQKIPDICPYLVEIHLSYSLSLSLIQKPRINLPSLQVLALDRSPSRSWETFYKGSNFGDGLSPQMPYGFGTSGWDLALRRVIERRRYADLMGRISLIEGWSQRSSGMPLMEIEFRLNARLREKALRRLAPLIDRGLRVVFKGDYYDLPPP